MNISIITPGPPASRKGNRVTALRWARLLGTLGHKVHVFQEYDGHDSDMMIALHAFRSASAIERFADQYPARPLVVALTGTDLYGPWRLRSEFRRSCERASRLVVLQPKALDTLPGKWRSKVSVIYQSVGAYRVPACPRVRTFDVCVLGHLRFVKDPFRAAMAARRLPRESRVRVLQVGAALDLRMEKRALAEQRRNPRYRWLGSMPRWRGLRVLSNSRLLAVTSKMEGGANVVSEAIVVGTPVISSRVDGSVGLLGDHYPGYFTVGDTSGLTELMWRVETDHRFYGQLVSRCRRLSPLFDPAKEQRAWQKLIRQLHL